jgi:acylphosphatase
MPQHLSIAPALLLLPVWMMFGPTSLSRTENLPTVARMVHYSGQVQGVGFRAATAEIAQKHAVTGWVKNLTDGRVQLLAEGREDEVQAFLEAVHRRWQKNIDKEQGDKPAPSGKFKKFEIVP